MSSVRVDYKDDAISCWCLVSIMSTETLMYQSSIDVKSEMIVATGLRDCEPIHLVFIHALRLGAAVSNDRLSWYNYFLLS